MTLDELEASLRTFSESEKDHYHHQHQLSRKYQDMPFVMHHGVKTYIFSFLANLSDEGIWLMKESRFTPIPAHIHDVIEMSYIYSGSCTQRINGEELKLEQDDVVLLDTKAVHEIYPLGEHDLVITIVTRRSNIMRNILPHLQTQGLITSFLAQSLFTNVMEDHHLLFRHTGDQLRPILQQLMLDYFNGATPNLLNAYMIILYSRLTHIYQAQHMDDPSSCSANSSERDTSKLVRILNYMEAHPHKKLYELAQIFGYNEAYLGNLIRQKTGRSYRAITQERRLELAKTLLASSDLPIYAIADQLGYTNLGHFYKKFSAYTGQTPQLYRDKIHTLDPAHRTTPLSSR